MILAPINIYIIYRSNIYMAPKYEKHIKNISKAFLINKLNQKITRKMLRQIGLIGLIQPELSRGKAKKLIYFKFG